MDRRVIQAAPGVLVATADMFLTTSTVVTAPGGRCLVIDPAVTVAGVAALAAGLRARGLTPVAGFATHAHWDHVLWSAELGDVPRYASPGTARAAREHREDILAGARSSAPGHDRELIGRLTPLGPAETAIPWPGPPATLVIHDGHAPGHAGVFLPDTGVLVAGDMCSDVEIPLLDLTAADPLGDYRAGLERLAALPVRLVVPGHGRPGGPAEFRRRAEADLRYLESLEGGADAADERLTEDWLIEAHRAQLSWARGRPAP